MRNIFILLILFFFSLSADGFWSEVQKNSFHSGRADMAGQIVSPEISWNYYRGGSLPAQSVAFDSDGNIYFSINGVVRAFDSDLNQLWESEKFEAGKIFKIVDLNKDGEDEIVVAGEDGVKILSKEDGTILSTIETKSPNFVKIADLNNDDSKDVVVRGGWGLPLVKAYDLKIDISNPSKIWEIKDIIPIYGFEIAVGDLDNTSGKEIAFDRMKGLLISFFKSSDGTLLVNKDKISDANYAYGFNQIVNVDGDNQNEFIFSGSISAESDKGSYSITVYDYVKDSIQWSYEYGWNTENKGFRMVPGSVGDFNGDGVIDVVISVFNNTTEGASDLDGVDAPDIWTTLIYRGDNGTLQAKIDNKYLDGVVDVNDDGKSEFVLRVAPDSGRALREYSKVSLYGFSEGNFKEYWSKEKVKILPTKPEDTEDVGVTFVNNVPSIVSSGSGKAFLMVEDINRDGIADRVFSIGGKDSSVVSDNTYLAGGEEFGFIHATESDIYFTGNDGFIHIFKRGSNLSDERTIPTGTFNSDSILINSFSGEKILTQVSMSQSVLLDPKDASIITEPEVSWSKVNQSSQPVFAFDSDGDGKHEFVSLSTDDEGYTDLYLHGSEGGLLWGWTVGKTTTNPKNFISGDFDGDGYKDVAFTFTSEEEGAMIYTLRGLDGAEIGSHDPQIDISGYYNNNLSLLLDINDDGSEDIYVGHSFASETLNGDGLERISTVTLYSWPNNAVVTDSEGTGEKNIFANQRTGIKKDMLDNELNILWTIDTSDESGPYYQYANPSPGISKIDSDEGFDLVLAGKFGDVSAYSGADGTVLWRRCLSGGESSDISVSVIPTEELCDGTPLTHIVTGDVDGDGGEEFVVGDRDGYLYLINADDGTLVWNMKFDAALGNPILADSDGDGKIEIIVGVGDGYLYCIDSRKIIAAPGFVSDVAVTDEDKIPTDIADVDEVLQARSYGAVWDSVKEAVSYDVRLKKGDDGEVLTERSVVGANQIVVDDFTFYRGDFLLLEVRSVDLGGFKSEWVASDGVIYVDELTDDSDDAEDVEDVEDSDDFEEMGDSDIVDILTDEIPKTDAEISDVDNDINIEIKKNSDGCGCSLI